jgi:hypothetical protein
VAAWFLLAAPARASGAVDNPSKGFVSARYQAKSCDTADTAAQERTRLGQFAAAGPDLAPRATIRPGMRPGSRVSPLQYQLRNSILERAHSHSHTFRTTEAVNSAGSCSTISSSIASTTFETSIPEDGRRLLQLAVAFAIAYVIFLTAWFWGTRERRSRVGRAARS